MDQTVLQAVVWLVFIVLVSPASLSYALPSDRLLWLLQSRPTCWILPPGQAGRHLAPGRGADWLELAWDRRDGPELGVHGDLGLGVHGDLGLGCMGDLGTRKQ